MSGGISGSPLDFEITTVEYKKENSVLFRGSVHHGIIKMYLY